MQSYLNIIHTQKEIYRCFIIYTIYCVSRENRSSELVTLATPGMMWLMMWILKNDKDLLEYIQSMSIFVYNSIQAFHFYTLYTDIRNSTLNDKIIELV